VIKGLSFQSQAAVKSPSSEDNVKKDRMSTDEVIS